MRGGIYQRSRPARRTPRAFVRRIPLEYTRQPASRGRSSIGRAPRLQRGGWRFEPARLHTFSADGGCEPVGPFHLAAPLAGRSPLLHRGIEIAPQAGRLNVSSSRCQLIRDVACHMSGLGPIFSFTTRVASSSFRKTSGDSLISAALAFWTI